MIHKNDKDELRIFFTVTGLEIFETPKNFIRLDARRTHFRRRGEVREEVGDPEALCR